MAVSQGQLIPVTDLAGNLRYQGPLNASGNGLSNFTFQVKDDGGGHARRGSRSRGQSATRSRSTWPRSTIRSWAADKTVVMNEDAIYTFAATDFARPIWPIRRPTP